MKGHMQDGKFHPHTDYKKGVRKSRDPKEKTQGVKLPTIRKARIAVSYDSLPSDVQNKFTPEEIETLANLKDSFNSSAGYIEDILSGDDLQGNLEYVVHDWIGDPDRNDELVSWLDQLSGALTRIQGEEFEATHTTIDVPKDKVLDLIRKEGVISSIDLVDQLTGTGQNQRERNKIEADLHLVDLENEGKITYDNTGWRIRR